jgi:large subunit ribosomal protein L17
MRHLKPIEIGTDQPNTASRCCATSATSLVNSREDRIVTTLPKAKELRPFIEKAITLSRRAASLEGNGAEVQSVHLRGRQRLIFTPATFVGPITTRRGQIPPPRTAGVLALKRLFDELGERFKDRPGGYTRIIKMGRRAGDGAELAIIELVDNAREKEAQSAREEAAKRFRARRSQPTESCRH